MMQISSGMIKALSTVGTVLQIEYLALLASKVEPDERDAKIAAASRPWKLFRSYPYALTQVVAVNHLIADV